MKLIREGRMGLPKSFKTGAVVGTYPKPMLAVVFKPEELDILPAKGAVATNGEIQMDTCSEEVVHIKPDELAKWAAKPEAEQPKVLALNLGQQPDGSDLFTKDFKIRPNGASYSKFIEASNYLCKLRPFPWKTVVMDNLSDLEEIILQGMAQFNPQAFSTAWDWAGFCGSKVIQVVTGYFTLPAHVVFILHSKIEVNKITGEINHLPRIYSSLREILAKLPSAFLYATKENGKPVVYTTDRGLVKGIGTRWPQGLPPVCQPDFRSIYGKELV